MKPLSRHPKQQKRATPPVPSPQGRGRLLIAAVTWVASFFLLFGSLGHYALWDDEAGTALHGQGVWLTGDTTAVIGHNIVAYREGAVLKNLHERMLAPLQSYLVAPFLGLMGNTAFAARLPFAFCGLLVVGWMLWWLWKENADTRTWMVFCLGILGNTSLFLFCRQCRYYSLAILFSLGMVYAYTHWKGRRRDLALFTVCSILLFASQYFIFVVVYACLAVDYALWERHRMQLTRGQVTAMAVPHLLCCGFLASIWNPLNSPWNDYLKQQQDGLYERLCIFVWNFRDLNACEFGVGLLLLAALGWAVWKRDRWLARGCALIGTYVVVTTVLTPQRNIDTTQLADVRYLCPLIPLCIAMGARVILLATARAPWLAIPLALLAFETNLLHIKTYHRPEGPSTIASFVRELTNPQPEPYTAAAQWINENLGAGESVWVLPQAMTYPLMFHVPKVIYAWQLPPPPSGQFAKLSPIYFKGGPPPDHIIVFGPIVLQMGQTLQNCNGASYALEAALNVYWRDFYRPELALRSFETLRKFNPDADGIYIFKRVERE